VGTLVEINSENSSVALENVTSYGTETRKEGAEAVAPSDRLYEYIVFRGSDVKDLRIEETRKEEAPAPPQMPNDPAILGVS
jgi:protein LSM14